jgi:hypothetical protein
MRRSVRQRLESLQEILISSNREDMSGPSLLYFGIGGGTLLLALSLLRKRYVLRDPIAVQSGGGYTMFAILMLVFAVGACLAGYFSGS